MRSVPLVAGCMLPDKGLCHALLGSAAHLDPVSGNCILSEQSICEICAMLGRKQGMTIDSESSLLCRLGQLGGQGMSPCLHFWRCGNGEKVKFSFCPPAKSFWQFSWGETNGMGSSWTLGNYLHIWVGKACWLTKRKWLWEAPPLKQVELSRFQLWTQGHAPDTLSQPWTPVFSVSPSHCTWAVSQLPITHQLPSEQTVDTYLYLQTEC